MKTGLFNIGPQHPASHGVLRLMVETHGKLALNINLHIGYLHRGTEKLMERNKLSDNISYFDRFDYVSTLNSEECYALLLENMFFYLPDKQRIQEDEQFFCSLDRQQHIFLVELSRINNHLLALTTNAIDIRAITPFL